MQSRFTLPAILLLVCAGCSSTSGLGGFTNDILRLPAVVLDSKSEEATDDATAQKFKRALLEFDPVEHLGRDRLGNHEQITGFQEIDEEAMSDLRTKLLGGDDK